jgi:hypothetical protein
MYSLALHEQKQHGTPEFPVAYYYVDRAHPRYQMPFHWHNEWELLHILEGNFQLHMDDDEYLAREDLQAVLREIIGSWYEDPRQMYLFFYYPKDEDLALLSMFDEMVAEYAKVSLQGVACVVAMRGGAQRLREGGFHVAASELKDRAMADYLTNAGRDTAACYAIYDKMEASLQVDAVDQRGRNASEALLSLKRTPNNTLPIFWSLGKDKKWPAPFKRA